MFYRRGRSSVCTCAQGLVIWGGFTPDPCPVPSHSFSRQHAGDGPGLGATAAVLFAAVSLLGIATLALLR